MRVLLTGAAGFVGSAVADLLAERGHEVVGVDALIPEAHGEDATLDPGSGVRRLDLREPGAALDDLLAGVDAVCHQAAMVGAGMSPADLPLYAGHNDLATALLLAAMHRTGVDRIVLASSMVVYGEGRYRCTEHGDQQPPPRTTERLDAGEFDNACPRCGRALGWALVDEDARLDPRSSYAASKVAQEHYLRAWARQAGGAGLALRYHNVYGPGMPRDTPYSGVAALFRSALEDGRAPEVFEDGGQMRDFVHVDDVAQANVLALERVLGDPAGGVPAYNVCSGRPVSILDVARRITAGVGAAGLEPRVSGRYRSGDVRHIVAAPERASAELGFTARVAPADGLARFAGDPLRG